MTVPKKFQNFERNATMLSLMREGGEKDEI